MTAAISISVPAAPRALFEPAKRESVRADAQATGPARWVSRLMEKEGPGLLRMLYRLLGSEPDVLDAYQDCFCKLASYQGWRKIQNPKAYLYRTAGNIAIEFLRQRQRSRTHLPNAAALRGTESVDGRAADECGEPVIELRLAIAELPSHLRNVVILRDLSGLSYEDVGRTLGIEPATARVYRRHAVVRLSEILGKKGTS